MSSTSRSDESAPGWPREARYLGKPTPRIDGPVKVTGAARFSSDQQPQGMLFGAVLRSRWAAAKIKSIDLSAALRRPGVRAAVVVREGERTVRYYGDELAAVAAESQQAAFDALQAIQVDAEPLPFVVDALTAAASRAPRVFAEDASNVGKPRVRSQGDVDAGFSQADIVVEGMFATQVEIHHPMETHGGVADFHDGELTSWHSTQGISGVRDGLAGNLGLPQSKVRVVSDFMGGGFGSKFSAGVEGVLAARLSKEAGAPVRLMLTRFDQSLAVGNRPSTFQKIRLGAKKDGTLTAFTMESYGCAGYATGGPSAGGSTSSGFPAPYIYHVPNVRAQHSEIAMNTGPAAAFRAPGHPPASFGMESIMDELAVRLGMDPVELRILNDPFEIRRREYAIAAERFGWKAKYKAPGTSPGVLKRGIGCAGATWGGGGRGTQAEMEINPDGTLEIRCGTQDLGTGTKTLIAVVAAEVLGLTPDEVGVRLGDSRFPPSGASGGSTTAASVSPAIFDVCSNALKQLKEASGLADVRGSRWKEACRKLGVRPLVVTGRWREGLSSSGAGGVQMVEVEVDTETGFVRIERILCVQDCGLVVNKLTCESQVNGGIIMGIGYALYENRVMDAATGVLLNPNYETYKLPGMADVPPIDIVLLDMPERGVIGVGEPVTIPTAAAIANAVANAIGVRVSSLPITPDKVLAALGRLPGKSGEMTNDAWMKLFAAR